MGMGGLSGQGPEARKRAVTETLAAGTEPLLILFLGPAQGGKVLELMRHVLAGILNGPNRTIAGCSAIGLDRHGHAPQKASP